MVTHEATSIVPGPSQATQEKRGATITIIWVATFSLWNNGGPLVSVSHWVIFLYLLYYKLGQSSRTAKNRKEWRTTHKGRSSRLPSRVCTTDLQNLTASRCPLHGLTFSLVTLIRVSYCPVNQFTSRVACMFLPYEPHPLPGMTFHLLVQKLFKNPHSVLLEQTLRLHLLRWVFDSSPYYFLYLVFSCCLQIVNSLIAEILSCFLWKNYIWCFPYLWVIDTYLRLEVLKFFFIWSFKVLFSLRTVCKK